MAAGVRDEDLGEIQNTGAVSLIYSQGEELANLGDQLWHQGSSGIPGGNETNDYWGTALVMDNFNGDNYDDLVIGVPYEDIGDVADGGAATILYGNAGGFRTLNSEMFYQETLFAWGASEDHERFGEALAAGDFDADGFADLAIGIPGEGIFVFQEGEQAQAGWVNVLYGSSLGLYEDVGAWYSHNSTAYAEFGKALAVGDFDGDGYDDLAVGVPGYVVGGHEDAGAVEIIFGSSTGLAEAGRESWTQDSPGIVGEAALADGFGSALAAGDFDGDGHTDLAIGVPYDNVSGHAMAGAVNLLYGTAAGLNQADNQLWHQDQLDVLGTAEENDTFGWSLASGDFNMDTIDDLAVGVPGEEVSGQDGAGMVNVLYGHLDVLTAENNQWWHQNSEGVSGVVEYMDRFGSSLAAGSLNGDLYDDLAIGVPYEDLDSVVDAGVVNILYGSATRLGADENQLWSQETSLIEDDPEANDHYG